MASIPEKSRSGLTREITHRGGSRLPRIGFRDDRPFRDFEEDAPPPVVVSARSRFPADLIDRVAARVEVGDEPLEVPDRVPARQQLTLGIDATVGDRHRPSPRVRPPFIAPLATLRS